MWTIPFEVRTRRDLPQPDGNDVSRHACYKDGGEHVYCQRPSFEVELTDYIHYCLCMQRHTYTYKQIYKGEFGEFLRGCGPGA